MRWPTKRVVASMMGSLPGGGAVYGTPIHAFVSAPEILNFSSSINLKPTRHDIDLGGHLAFLINSVITDDEADAIIAASEEFGFRQEAPGISTPPGMRMNKSVHWVADQLMLGPIMQRISPLLPKQINGAQLHDQLSHRINMYRYDNQDIFNQHVDGDWPGYGLNESRTQMTEWPILRSCLTMLLYLNGHEDGVQGGNTRLLSANGEWVDIAPKKGAALFFRHGFGDESVSHIGARVLGETSKYVARINVMYKQE